MVVAVAVVVQAVVVVVTVVAVVTVAVVVVVVVVVLLIGRRPDTLYHPALLQHKRKRARYTTVADRAITGLRS